MYERTYDLDISLYSNLFGHGLGYFCSGVVNTDRGKVLINPSIFINPSGFVLGNTDYSDLRDIFVRHEIYELWLYAKNGWSTQSLSKQEDPNHPTHVSHNLALREQYRYAFRTGREKRLLNFIKSFYCNCTNIVLIHRGFEEQLSAYHHALDWHYRHLPNEE